MAPLFDTTCARCRLAGEKLFLKGEKCFTPKCPLVRRSYVPGIHGPAQARRKRRTISEYGRQLREKQALRAIYGVSDGQLARTYAEARLRRGVTGDTLLRFLESRLDNVVFRAGFGSSRAHARQLVHHGLIVVNGRRMDIPSYRVSVGQTIAVSPGKRAKPAFADLADRLRGKILPAWLIREDTWVVKVASEPGLGAPEVPVDVQAVVEFYAR